MNVVVFCGPTVSAATVAAELVADVRGPAERGDVLRAALQRPDAIVLIDGYFDRVPSVWHKEILWAMSQGIHVFGASSMGALRAAELATFGMVGVGEIYQAFARGELEDDDEVAIAHGDAESGYRRASEAMVNIRWTLRAAERQGIVSATTRSRLEERIKALPYDRRDLRLAFEADQLDGAEETPDADRAMAGARLEISALRRWLPGGRIDQKREDAIAVLRHVAALEGAGWHPRPVAYCLADTDGWVSLMAEVEGAVGRRCERVVERGLEDELRARGMLGKTLLAGMMRQLAAGRLRDARLDLNARAVEVWIDDFRRERGLLSAQSFDAWLGSTGLTGVALEDFFRREAVVRATRAELRTAIGAAVEDELHAAGLLRTIQSFAVRKDAALARRGLTAPTLDDAGLTEPELWQWFFRERLGIPVPQSMSAYAAAEGSTVEDIRIAALRDAVFSRIHERAEDSALNPKRDGATP